MDEYLTRLYMRFLCERLRERAPELCCRGSVTYRARLHHSDKRDEWKSVLQVAGEGPRAMAFRLADIIKYHRERVWQAPAFICPEEGAGIAVIDNITLGSGVRLGQLADSTAAAIAIFLEKYLIKG